MSDHNGLPCPNCGSGQHEVRDSRKSPAYPAIRRRRYCEGCSQSFTTLEMALKTDGTLIGHPVKKERASAMAKRLARFLESKGL